MVEFDGADPLAYVVSLNLTRRHLSESQRASIAARIADMPQGARTDLASSANLQKVSQADAARMLNVSPRSVASAKHLQDEAPELLPAVDAGDLSVSLAAQVAALPPEARAAVVAAEPAETRAVARAYVANATGHTPPEIEARSVTSDRRRSRTDPTISRILRNLSDNVLLAEVRRRGFTVGRAAE